jgi:hypothetical protein
LKRESVMDKPRNSEEAKTILDELRKKEAMARSMVRTREEALDKITKQREALETECERLSLPLKEKQRSLHEKQNEEGRARGQLDNSRRELEETSNGLTRLQGRIQVAAQLSAEPGIDPNIVWELSEYDVRQMNDRLGSMSELRRQTRDLTDFVSKKRAEVLARDRAESEKALARERASQKAEVSRERAELVARLKELDDGLKIIDKNIDALRCVEHGEDQIQRLQEERSRMQESRIETSERLRQLDSH